MAIRYYDEALANKIKAWVKDPNIKVLKPDETAELFKIQADEKKDMPITLPLIALSRLPRISILKTGKNPMSYDGLKIFAYDNDGKIVANDKMQKLNAIPIQLEYQLDIYTKELAECDEYFRNFVFNFINYPNVTIEIPYNDCKLTHNSTIYLDAEAEDTSDIPQRLFPKQFSRYTLRFTIDDAYIFSAPIKSNILISEVKLEIKNDEKETLETYEVYKEK